MCWLCGFKSQMLSVSTFCVFVCQHLCICVLCTCSFTSTLLCVWTPCGTSVPPSTSNTGAPKGHQLKREKFLVKNQVFPGETGGMRAVGTLFRATITRPSQTAPTSLSPSGWIFCILYVFCIFRLLSCTVHRPLDGLFRCASISWIQFVSQSPFSNLR